MTIRYGRRHNVRVRKPRSRLEAGRKLAILHKYWCRHSLRIGRKVRDLRSHPGVSTGTAWPVTGVVTSLFGRRTDPVGSGAQFHPGIDIYVPYGTPVRAVQRGRVRFAGYLDRYGKTVVLSHGRKIRTLYAHNSQLSVRKGQRVRKGQVIALSGATGRTTGPHVHYEVWVRGRCIDPLRCLKKNPRSVYAEVIERL